MKSRYKRYEDYGITADEGQYTVERCRRLNSVEKNILLDECIRHANGVEIPVFASLVGGHGFYKIRRVMDMPIEKADDFYGYRRKVVAFFYKRMRLEGRW